MSVCGIEPLAVFDNFFTQSELSDIIAMMEARRLVAARVVDTKGEDVLLNDVRRSSVAMIHRKDPEAKRLFDMLDSLVSRVNAEYYQFDLSYGFEHVQYTEYHASTNDKYDFHADFMWGDQLKDEHDVRKLSISFVLSDPSEFEGGDFEYFHGSDMIQRVQQRKGRALVFPSWVIHRVTPVTKGVRRSLVLWARGPRLR